MFWVVLFVQCDSKSRTTDKIVFRLIIGQCSQTTVHTVNEIRNCIEFIIQNKFVEIKNVNDDQAERLLGLVAERVFKLLNEFTL